MKEITKKNIQPLLFAVGGGGVNCDISDDLT